MENALVLGEQSILILGIAKISAIAMSGIFATILFRTNPKVIDQLKGSRFLVWQ